MAVEMASTTIICPSCGGDRFFIVREGDSMESSETTDCGLCDGRGTIVGDAPESDDDTPLDQDDQSWRDLTDADIASIRNA